MMITRLSEFPNNVIAVACSGRVTAHDYETVLVPAVEQALSQHDKLRLYYEIKPDFAGLEPAAMWDDFKLGVEHFSRWERVAVVTDVEWIRLAVEAFAFLMPGEVRVFSLTGIAKARGWITATSAVRPRDQPAGPTKREARLEESEFEMLELEELERRRGQIAGDMKRLFEKYRAIFDWEVPEIDQPVADSLILVEMQKALDLIKK